MAKKGAREAVALVCTVCKNQNYITTRNKVNMELKAKKGSKLELNKYCHACRKVQIHKETSKLK
jgi:large subunit ribosomal protein L33